MSYIKMNLKNGQNWTEDHIAHIETGIATNESKIDVIDKIINSVNDYTCDTSYYESEIADTVSKLRAACTDKSLVFAVVTDTHLNAEREEAFTKTLKNIKAVNEQFAIDFLFHLGDMIDSDPSRDKAIGYIEKIVNGFRSIVPNTFIINGNHDDNSSKENNSAIKLQPGERYAIFNRFNDIHVNRPGNKEYFYFDVDSMGVRFICLNSTIEVASGNSPLDSWGFPQEEITWLEDVALKTDYKVILTSHMGLIKDTICHGITPKNGTAVINAINNFQSNGGEVIGLFIGHCHWDYITNETGFNIVSTDCWKLDDTGFSTLGAHPSGAVKTTGRVDGTVTENAWDIVVVNTETGLVKIIRFGAGNDREYKYLSDSDPDNLLDTILTVNATGIGTGEVISAGPKVSVKGAPYDATTMHCSDFIPVNSGDAITYCLRGAGPWAAVLAFYTSNDVDTVVDVVPSVNTTLDVTGTYTCPSDGYIRIANRVDYNDGYVYIK